MQIKGVLKGDTELMLTLARIGKQTPGVLGSALEAEAGTELEEMIQRTPWDTGALRESGAHSKWFQYKGAVAVLLRFGGPDAWYAVIVEKGRQEHAVGQRRYMGSVVSEARRNLLGRIARDIGFGDKWIVPASGKR